MPIYEYQCESCEQRTEAIQRLDEPPLIICPHCGGPLVKLMSAPSFQFKGTGWYVTDYAGKGKAGKKEGKAGGEESSASTSSSSGSSSGSSSPGGKSESGGGGSSAKGSESSSSSS